MLVSIGDISENLLVLGALKKPCLRLFWVLGCMFLMLLNLLTLFLGGGEVKKTRGVLFNQRDYNCFSCDSGSSVAGVWEERPVWARCWWMGPRIGSVWFLILFLSWSLYAH